MSTATKLLTAREYALLPDDGTPTELVRGEVVEMSSPYPRHGQICSRIDRIIGNFADEHTLGHVVSNDSGVITEHNPDTVRGPDVAFYSYGRVPAGPFPANQYLAAVPELVFEVRFPSDRWRDVIAKVNEYLQAGIGIVCVVDDSAENVRVFEDDDIRFLNRNDELTFSKVLPGFSTPVRRLFE